VSLSFYTEEQLRKGTGSLFAAHLKRDAQVLTDQSGELTGLITELGELDALRLMSRVYSLCAVLGSLDWDLPKYLPGLLREAKYLLRSALYGKAIMEGRMCFSVRELATRYDDPDLVELLSSRPSGEATILELRGCIDGLERLFGQLPSNPHGSLEALIVNEWGTQNDLVAMGMLALGGTESELDYVEVKKVLL